MNDSIAIRTEGLTRDFNTVRALDSLDLEIPRGIVFGFLGPNGAGKTTTIRLLLGLLEPTQGRAQVLGLDTRSQSQRIREQTGALLEHTGLYERLTAEDNLDFYGRVYHLEPAKRRARIQELLQHLGLWERRKESLAGWSRGMKQKAAIARALLHRPRLLFLDEPTSGLDPVAAAALREDLANLAESERVTVFLTTHNLTDAERLCQQVAIIRSGKLLALGSPHDLRQRTGGERVEVFGRGFTPELIARLKSLRDVREVEQVNDHLVVTVLAGVQFSGITALLVGSGAAVEELRRGKTSLEDVFLDLVEDKAE
jgi:ABC-2 type transport system ATP-binding protein